MGATSGGAFEGKDFSNLVKVGTPAPEASINSGGRYDVGKLADSGSLIGTPSGSLLLDTSLVFVVVLGQGGTSPCKVGSKDVAPEAVVISEFAEANLSSVDGKKWSTLFVAKLKEKSSPPTDFFANPSEGEYSVSVPNCIIDKGLLSMEQALVGNFLGLCPNIEMVRMLAKN